MIDVFILGYNGADYFTDWHTNFHFSDNIRFHFIDNGNQKLSNHINNILLYQTSTNIFCAGGWNLICDLGFDYMNLDKIIIGQEDGMFNDKIIMEIYENTNENMIYSAYDNSFDFSLFGLHKDTFNLVGRFDENFLIAGDEDSDYKQRCKLNGIKIKSMDIPSVNNISITGQIRQPYARRNADYLHTKWGMLSVTENRIYEYELPYNGEKPFHMTDDYREWFDIPHDQNEYMSEIEYALFKKSMDLK